MRSRRQGKERLDKKGVCLCSKQHVVSALDSEHEGVVLVADLVLPAAKAAARPDVVFPQPWQSLIQSSISVQMWSGIAMLQSPV